MLEKIKMGKKIIEMEKIFENGKKKISKYVQGKNWRRAYRVSFFSQGSGRVVTSCVVFEQWISAVVLFKLQTLQTTFAVVLLLSKLQNYFTIFYYLHADTFVSHQLFYTIIFLLAML